MDEQTTNSSMLSLDRHSLIEIMCVLDPKSVCTMGCVSKELRIVSKSDLIWAPLVYRHFGLRLEVSAGRVEAP